MIFQAPASGIVRISPDFPDGVDHVLGIYNEHGETIKSFSSTRPGSGNLLLDGLTPGDNYYGLFLPLSLTRQEVTGTILIEEVQSGDCGYTGADSRSVSGTVDFSTFGLSGLSVTSVKILAILPESGGATAGFRTVLPANFNADGFTADYSITGMDPLIGYDFYFLVMTQYDGNASISEDGPDTPNINAGNVTEFNHTFGDVYIAEIIVNLEYTGTGIVDADHPLFINLDLSDHGDIQDTQSLESNSGQVTLQTITLQPEVYIDAAYDVDGSGWHTDWDPMYFYGETAEDRTPVPIDISSGSVTINFSFDDSIRFNVDDRSAYPLLIDGTWYGLLEGSAYLNLTFDSGPDFLYGLESDDKSTWENYRIWEWDNDSGFLIVQVIESSDTGSNSIGKYIPVGWDNLSGSGDDASMDFFAYGDDDDNCLFDTLEEAQVVIRTNPMSGMALTASLPAAGTATVQGTVTLPATVTGMPYAVVVDTDNDGGNGIISVATGTVTGSSFTYTIGSVPAGTYMVYAIVWIVGEENQAPINGDYLSHDFSYVTIIANETNTVNRTLIERNESSTVSGTVSVPAGLNGRSYLIALDEDGSVDGDNTVDFMTDTIPGDGEATSISYEFTGIEQGTYYVYAIIYLDSENLGQVPSEGDYLGYGWEDFITNDVLDYSNVDITNVRLYTGS